MIRAAIALALAGLLSGCASQYWAGVSQYKISPLIDAQGTVTGCCTLLVTSGKEAQTVNASFIKAGDNYTITLNEVDVRAFPGQQISANAAANIAASAATAAVKAIKSLP